MTYRPDPGAEPGPIQASAQLLEAEADAWEEANEALRELGFAWDDDEIARLAVWVKFWGETLAALRHEQPQSVRDRWYEDADANVAALDG